MWGVFKKIIELRVSSIIVLALIGMVAIALGLKAKDNMAATIGCLACIALFVLMGLYLVIYNHVRELFSTLMQNEREGNQVLLKNYKDLAREQNRTALMRERASRENISGNGTPVASSTTYANYREATPLPILTKADIKSIEYV